MTNPAPAELTRNEVLKLLRDVKDILYFHRPGFMGPLNEWAMTDEALRASRDEYKRKYEEARSKAISYDLDESGIQYRMQICNDLVNPSTTL